MILAKFQIATKFGNFSYSQNQEICGERSNLLRHISMSKIYIENSKRFDRDPSFYPTMLDSHLFSFDYFQQQISNTHIQEF